MIFKCHITGAIPFLTVAVGLVQHSVAFSDRTTNELDFTMESSSRRFIIVIDEVIIENNRTDELRNLMENDEIVYSNKS